jgi:hypothetical protein
VTVREEIAQADLEMVSGRSLPAPFCCWAIADSPWWTPGFSRGARARISTGCFATARGEPEPPQPVSVHRSERGRRHVARQLIGRIEIPTAASFCGGYRRGRQTSLRRAVGHIPGTALPGEAGNVGVAGHRDTFFRPLKDVKIKDEIQSRRCKAISSTKSSR